MGGGAWTGAERALPVTSLLPLSAFAHSVSDGCCSHPRIQEHQGPSRARENSSTKKETVSDKEQMSKETGWGGGKGRQVRSG